MPTYEYRCPKCEKPFEVFLPMSRYDESQNCPECGEGPAVRLVSGGAGFILKGDDWASKNNRVKGQMASNRQRAGVRQKEMVRDAPSVTLVPNVAGERTESWSDASKLAASKGKDTAGYDSRAAKEKK